MRKFTSATCVHQVGLGMKAEYSLCSVETKVTDPFLQDFVSAVMDVDYAPTGREFVAGSYDRSVRIFK